MFPLIFVKKSKHVFQIKCVVKNNNTSQKVKKKLWTQLWSMVHSQGNIGVLFSGVINQCHWTPVKTTVQVLSHCGGNPFCFMQTVLEFLKRKYIEFQAPYMTMKKENWRILTSKEIYASVLKKPTIIQTIRLNRLRWFGHVQRMDENRIP